MIEIEGYCAFCGTIRIHPVSGPGFEITSDWLYKPDTGCWYGQGSSYPEEVCEVVEEDGPVYMVDGCYCRACRWGQIDDAGVMHCHKHHIHKRQCGFCDDGKPKKVKDDG